MLNAVTPEFIARLEGALPEGTVRPMRDGAVEDPRGRYEGQGRYVACPRTAKDVSMIVKLCNEARVGIVPLGGSTGLVLGQVAFEGPEPLILSLERMTAVRELLPSENVIVVEAGAILQRVQEAAAEVDRLYPLSLAAQGSCQIGGTLATNAGGVNVLRYGNARELCLGVEAVLPDGSIYHGLKRLRKDNTGFDLRNLLIGSEGALGVITAAALRLFPRPTSEATALVTVPSPQAAIELLALTRAHVGEAISAFELIAKMSFEFLDQTMPDIRQPFETFPEWAVLIDIGQASGAEAALVSVFEAALEAGLVEDGVLASSETEREALWALREHIPLANRAIGSVSSHDISVPVSRIPEFIPEGIKRLSDIGDMRVNCFGHLGDGNLHYNVFPADGKTREAYEAERPQVKRVIHDLVHEMDGSVSAEHGIGRLKVDDLKRYGDPAKLAAMRAIKDALDPHGIMNPGVILD